MQLFPLNTVTSKMLRFMAFVIKAEKHSSAICAFLQQHWVVWLWVHPLLQGRLAVWWGRPPLWIRCEALFLGWWIGFFSSNIGAGFCLLQGSQSVCLESRQGRHAEDRSRHPGQQAFCFAPSCGGGRSGFLQQCLRKGVGALGWGKIPAPV